MARPARPYLTAVVCWTAIVLLGLMAKLAIGLGRPGTGAGLDGQILAWFSTIRHPVLDRFFLAVTWAGSATLLLPLTLAVAIKLFIGRQTRAGIFLGSAMVGASLLTNLGKYLIARPRPALFPALAEVTSSYSLPSGHAVQITAFVLAGLWLLKRSMAGLWHTAATTGGGLILLVCLSRLYLQVHYPSDVLAGVLMAAFWVIGLAHLTMTTAPPNDPSPKR